jgi:hypothetical protein
MEITRNWLKKKKRERGQAIEYERNERKKSSNKHEKVNGMVKWNYLGHRRTVDPNKVTEHHPSTCAAEIFRLMDPSSVVGE